MLLSMGYEKHDKRHGVLKCGTFGGFGKGEGSEPTKTTSKKFRFPETPKSKTENRKTH
jgi:hypothetical protein